MFCGIGNDKKSFDLFINVSKQMLKDGSHKDWNEVTLRVDKDKYVDAVEAIFYFYATKEDYYLSPVGRLKKYNINLAKAQYYQKELYDREKVFKPIIAINMDVLYDGRGGFEYYPEDQLINID